MAGLGPFTEYEMARLMGVLSGEIFRTRLEFPLPERDEKIDDMIDELLGLHNKLEIVINDKS